MSTEKRNTRRIDYKILNETGQKVDKVQSTIITANQGLTLENKCEKSPISKLSLQLSNLTFDNMSEYKKQEAGTNVNSDDKSSMNEHDQEIINLKSKFIMLLEEIDDHIDENTINK